MNRIRKLFRRWPDALTGLLAVFSGLALAELLAAVLSRPSPFLSIGSTIIDATPTPLKEFAVREFGTADKPILLTTIAAAMVVLALVIGLLAAARPVIGLAGMAVFAIAGAVMALGRPTATAIDALPPVVGGLAAAGVLLLLRRLLHHEPERPSIASLSNRRRFLIGAGAVIVTGGAAAAGARFISSAGAVGEQSRAQVRLPAPASPAAPLPEGSDPIASFHTPNSDFYRVDTALSVPQIDAATWRLRVGGRVAREREYTFAELLARPLIERDITLVCVSNEVGGPYLGTARWLGVPLAELLAEAGVDADADQIVSTSVDGMTIGTPTRVVTDGRDAMLAVGMNGEPLPLTHGFPVRMLVPGLYGYVSACKWITGIELSRFDDFDPYWVRRDWAKEAPIKTSSRIDTPKALGKVPAGTTRVAGVAWAPHRGVTAVEVRVDNGAWQRATLASVPSTDTWRQWYLDWDATPGRHDITVRATDGGGEPQVEQRVTPFPDGATGWHSIAVRVE
ncbi:molybdopterin-dependent oxidoreductase [Phytomonospora endophytica]|uniref:DMSO/TMAO reductase YedYZ molybdopterin-dependent catalytic subunit n=1 Tax=Phytomonospora endophytica TaxID=714109 RepID=A0A841FYJ6_9ACTN|nr:molybdopterin-dependent oxidoreductase [Phytomonospora endophytica]MBB6038592.1 DMSO/TMAO reductase YedYZ molybdopterin-dependent catalytic subunit [Phytomonospora endophytica]GIG69265.1 oxidoreductase [Phytomonospora endophytica]